METIELQVFRQELKRICERLAPTSGQPCDECGCSLVGGERRYIVIIQLPFGNLLYSPCEKCAATGFPNVQDDAERIRERLVSDAVAALVEAGPMSMVLN